MKAPLLIAIMGPTAGGKTVIAEYLARELDARLINSDAFQIYRGLDVGTAKPRDRKRYELLDVREPNEAFGLGEWTRMAQAILEECFAARKHAVVVGGTGLYVRALFEEYSGMAGTPDPSLRESLNAASIEELRRRLVTEHPEIAGQVDLANPVRVRRAWERLYVGVSEPVRLPPFRKLKLAINPPVEVLNDRIAQRIAEMVHNGWTREIERLRDRGFRREDPGFRAIGYRTLWDHLERKISLDEATATTIAETRRYAKRQRTWLRTEPSLEEFSMAGEDAVRKTMERVQTALM